MCGLQLPEGLPPGLRAALRTIDQHIDQRLAQTRIPAATLDSAQVSKT